VTIPTPFTLGAVSVTPTGTELNFVDGVTSAIQTQIDGKFALSDFDNSTIDTSAGGALQVKDAGLLDAKMANNALDPDKLVGDATDDDKVDSNLIPKVSTSVVADTALYQAISTYTDVDVTGDVRVHGNFINDNWRRRVDINRAWADTPTTYITCPTYPGLEHATKDYSDSCAHVHVGRRYWPKPYETGTGYGWHQLMVGTPYPAGVSNYENPCLYASNNGDHWIALVKIDSVVFPWPDTVDEGQRGWYTSPGKTDSIMPDEWTWAYADEGNYDSAHLAIVFGDTVMNPIFHQDTFSATHLSDVDLDVSLTGEWLVTLRATQVNNKRFQVILAWASDPAVHGGAGWSSDSSIILVDSNECVAGFAPSLGVDSSGLYRLNFVEAAPLQSDDSFLFSDSHGVLVEWEATDFRSAVSWGPASTPWVAYMIDTQAVPDDTLRTIQGCVMVDNPDSTKYKLWHQEMVTLGVDDRLMFGVWCPLAQQGDSTFNRLSQNSGDGLFWRTADTNILQPTKTASHLRGRSIYRGSGFPTWDGSQHYIDWIFPGMQTNPSVGDATWHLFHAKIYFDAAHDEDTSLVNIIAREAQDTVDAWVQNKLTANNTETGIIVTYQSDDS
jgi:hypothetical protein